MNFIMQIIALFLVDKIIIFAYWDHYTFMRTLEYAHDFKVPKF